MREIFEANAAYWQSSEPTSGFLYDAFMHLDTHIAELNAAARILQVSPYDSHSQLQILQGEIRALYSCITLYSDLTGG